MKQQFVLQSTVNALRVFILVSITGNLRDLNILPDGSKLNKRCLG